MTTDGFVECREALAFPADPGRVVVLRRIVGGDCAVPIKVALSPRAKFGTQAMDEVRHAGHGVWTARTGPLSVRWSGGEGGHVRDGVFTLQFEIKPGEHRDLVLEISDRALDADPPDPDKLWESTAYAWDEAIPDLGHTLAPRDAMHAYAILRGLTSSTGGLVAAATTSLPERAEAGRNYDYRYAWIRDQAYAGQAVAVDRPLPLLDDAVGFICARLLADGPDLKPAYRIDGEPVPSERSVGGLAGYPGGSDRVGNRVNEQFQLDTLGESLLLLGAAAAHDHLDGVHWKAAEAAVAAIEARWTEPDAGIWEIDDEHWTHSRLTCVAGLRRISAFAPRAQAGRWQGLADTLLAAAGADGVHASGRWQRSTRDPKVDAALLFPAVRGAVPADDPRTLATIEAVRAELVEDHFVYRFRQEPGPLSRAEGAFILCGFVMALAEHQQGNHVSAVRYFERNRSACGTPGLFSEELDVNQRQLRGNLPQAFVHATLLEAAQRLAESPG
jgi:GH15 family glucan-1,4-alpha-glucosidase